MNESIKRLEEKIAHLEHHVTEQDKVMLEMAEDLATARREIKRLRERIEGGSLPAEGSLPEERPPHY